MRQAQHTIAVTAERQGLVEVTGPVAEWAGAQGMETGLLTVFIRHTSASLLIQENVDADVQRDLETHFDRMVPEDESLFRHTAEGPDDMPAHIKGAMTQSDLSIPLTGGRLALGRYQGIFLFEHRRRPRPRELVLHLMGE